jgi:hypothetical protein
MYCKHIFTLHAFAPSCKYFSPFCEFSSHSLDTLSFFFFLWYWVSNSGPTHWATPPALFVWRVFRDTVSQSICLGLALNCNPPDLYLLSFLNYRHEPSVPSSWHFLLQSCF